MTETVFSIALSDLPTFVPDRPTVNRFFQSQSPRNHRASTSRASLRRQGLSSQTLRVNRMLGGRGGTAFEMRNRLRSIARLDGPDTKALASALTILAALCVYRFYDFWTTGFFVSDEYGYFFDAVHGSIYSDRWLFGWMNIYLFKALGITSVDSFSYLLPFYMFFWTGLTLVVFYKMLKLLGFDTATVAVSLLSSFVLISFVLLSLGFLTEPVGLCFAMLGIYFLLRFQRAKGGGGLVGFSILAVLSFGAASGTREPYEAFLIGGVVIAVLIAFSH